MDAGERTVSAAAVGRARAAGALVPPLLITLLSAPTEARSQTIEGRVLEQGTARPVSDARVRLLERDGGTARAAISDSLGVWTLVAPGTGEYYLAVERPGYEDMRTPLLSVEDEDRSYALDLVVQRAPLGLPGLDVTVDGMERLERRLRLLIGGSVAGLRTPPVLKPTIEAHLARDHDLEDLVRWLNVPGLLIFRTRDGPCFMFRVTGLSSRESGCTRVYLNEAPLNREFTPVLPLDLSEVIVIVHPLESTRYPRGAILLYTKAWIG